MSTAARERPAKGARQGSTVDSIESLAERLVEAVTARLAIETRLLNREQVCELLDISQATFERLKSLGRLPAPIEFSQNCHKWNSVEVREWINAGCPDRAEWEKIKKRK